MAVYERNARALGLTIEGIRTSHASQDIDTLATNDWVAQLTGPYSAHKRFLSDLSLHENLSIQSIAFGRTAEKQTDTIAMNVSWKTWVRFDTTNRGELSQKPR